MAPNQKNVLGIGLGLLLSALAWVGLIRFQDGAQSPGSQWHDIIMRRKDEIAARKPSPKVIFASGSNVLFGISAEQFEKTTGIAAMNMGMGVDMAWPLILQHVLKGANSGDVVVLAPEYELFTYNVTEPSVVVMDYVMAHEQGFLLTLSPLNMLRWVFSLKWPRLWDGVRVKMGAASATPGSMTYSPYLVDDWGDETQNEGTHLAERNPGDYQNPQTFLFEEVPKTNSCWKTLHDFILTARERNIHVIVTYPSLVRQPAYSQYELKLPNQVMNFFRSEGVPVVGTFQDFSWPPEAHFDSRYHLNLLAKKFRTQLLVQFLTPELQKLCFRVRNNQVQ